MCGQGYKYILYCQFIIMDWLLDHTFNIQVDFKEYYTKYEDYEEYTYLKAAAYALQQKCKEYYNLVDNSVAYYIA